MRRIFPRKGITAVHNHSQPRSGARRSDVSLSRGTKLLPRVGARNRHFMAAAERRSTFIESQLCQFKIPIIFRGGRLSPRPKDGPDMMEQYGRAENRDRL